MLITVVNNRLPPEGSQLWWSTDAGATWCPRPLQLWDVAASAVLATPAEADARAPADDAVWDALQRYSFGTPGLQLLADGSVLYTYYGIVDGITHVRACRFSVRR
jgi:hypothetical protein